MQRATSLKLLAPGWATILTLAMGCGRPGASCDEAGDDDPLPHAEACESASDENELALGRIGGAAPAGEPKPDFDGGALALAAPHAGLTHHMGDEIALLAAAAVRRGRDDHAPQDGSEAARISDVAEAVHLFAKEVATPGALSLVDLAEDLGRALGRPLTVWQPKRPGGLEPVASAPGDAALGAIDIYWNGRNHFEALTDVHRQEGQEVLASYRRIDVPGNGDCLLQAAAVSLFPSYRALLDTAAPRDDSDAMVSLRGELVEAGLVDAERAPSVTFEQGQRLLASSLRQTLVTAWRRELVGPRAEEVAWRLLDLAHQEGAVRWADLGAGEPAESLRHLPELRLCERLTRPWPHRSMHGFIVQALDDASALLAGRHEGSQGDAQARPPETTLPS